MRRLVVAAGTLLLGAVPAYAAPNNHIEIHAPSGTEITFFTKGAMQSRKAMKGKAVFVTGTEKATVMASKRGYLPKKVKLSEEKYDAMIKGKNRTYIKNIRLVKKTDKKYMLSGRCSGYMGPDSLSKNLNGTLTARYKNHIYRTKVSKGRFSFGKVAAGYYTIKGTGHYADSGAQVNIRYSGQADVGADTKTDIFSKATGDTLHFSQGLH